jgi:hypothetical protein
MASGSNFVENPILTKAKKKIATGNVLIRKRYSLSRRVIKDQIDFMEKAWPIFALHG